MAKKRRINLTTNRALNWFNFLISVLVFGTGLVLFIKFHMGEGAHRKEWLGLAKWVWLTVHQIAAVGFLAGFAIHIQRHFKYIKMVAKRWRKNLPNRIKRTTFEQILLLAATMIVTGAGFYTWITMPGATLAIQRYHDWVDVHNRVGIFLILGMAVHVIRRWQRMF